VLRTEDQPYAGERLARIDGDEGVAAAVDVEVEVLDGQPKLVAGPDQPIDAVGTSGGDAGVGRMSRRGVADSLIAMTPSVQPWS
jgi:hypothetical protein